MQLQKPEVDFESFRDKEFTVEPFYGWGWCNSSGESAEVPEPFTITLKGLYINQNDSLAGAGFITSEDHPLSHRWVVFSQRHLGEASVMKKGTNFNISVHLTPPAVNEDTFISDNEILESDEALYGYCFVYLND